MRARKVWRGKVEYGQKFIVGDRKRQRDGKRLKCLTLIDFVGIASK